MTIVVISTKSRHPCPDGEYHYPKLKDAKLLERALSASSDVSEFRQLIDPDHDVVGFDITAVSVDAVKAVVERVFGNGHGLLVYDPYSNWPPKRSPETLRP